WNSRCRIGDEITFISAPSWTSRAWSRRPVTSCATSRNRWRLCQPRSGNETSPHVDRTGSGSASVTLAHRRETIVDTGREGHHGPRRTRSRAERDRCLAADTAPDQKADPLDIAKKATPEDTSVSSDRSVQEERKATRWAPQPRP